MSFQRVERVAFVLLFSVLSACSAPASNSTGGANAGRDEQDDWSNSCAREAIHSPGTGSTIRTPESMFSKLENDPFIDRYDRGEISVFQGRAWLDPTESQDEFWLSGDDEAAVFDFGFYEWGKSEPHTYRLMLFANFQPIPFAVSIAGRPQDVVDDESALQLNNLAPSNEITVNSEEALVATLVVPRDQFTTRGSIDLRVVAVPVTRPDDEADMVRGRMPFSRAATLNVADPKTFHPGDLAALSGRTVSDLSWSIDHFLYRTAGDFLTPPRSAVDLENSREPAGLTLGGTYSPSDQPIELSAYLSGASDFENEAGPVYVITLRNDTVVEAASGMMTLPALPSGTRELKDNTAKDYAVEVPIQLDHDADQRDVIRVLKFPYPYCRTPRDHGRYSRQAAGISNTIFLE